jgi:hypothetical protein
LVPDIEGHVLVHHAHEWINGYRGFTFLCERLLDLLIHNLLKLIKCVELAFEQNLLLGATRHVTTLHCLVEKLIEVDETIGITKNNQLIIDLRLDVHDHKFSFNASSIIFHLRHSQITLKGCEKPLNLSASNFVSIKILRLNSPYHFEFRHVILESVEYIIIWKIIKVELLKNNQDEQVDHDVLLDDHEDDVEDEGPDSTAVHSRDAVSVGVHAVEHNYGPVFSRRKPQHHHEGVGEGREVHVIVYLFSLSDFSEEEDAKD